MSDLGQSFFRCLQALSRAGVGPFTNAENANKAADPEVLDRMTEAAAAQLDPFLNRLFRVGDRLQRGVAESAEILFDERPDPDATLIQTWEAIDRTRDEDF